MCKVVYEKGIKPNIFSDIKTPDGRLKLGALVGRTISILATFRKDEPIELTAQVTSIAKAGGMPGFIFSLSVQTLDHYGTYEVRGISVRWDEPELYLERNFPNFVEIEKIILH